jgi:ATP:ADP antiporter, AAA family
VSPAILAAGLLVAQQVAGKATRDALFLSEFDVTTLPLMSGAAAMVSLLAVLAFARGMAMFSPGRMVPLALALSAVLLLGEWGLSGPLPRLAAVAVYFHTVIFSPILVSGFWSLVNERFDPHSAKLAVGRIVRGSSLGGLIGGLITWQAATLIRVPTMLVGMAALNLLCLRPLLQLRPALKAPPSVAEKSAAPAAKAVSGLRLIREVPYLRDLAFLVGLCAFIEALLDYVFTASAAAGFARGAALMSFFALFHTVVGLLTLGLQTNLVPPSLGRLGLAGTLFIQPAAMALGSAVALFFPRLWPIVVMRGSQAALRNSLFRSAYELFYTPLPQEQKRPTKAIVDVGFDRLGTAAGSAVVMGVLFLASAGPTRVLLALAAASAGLAITLAPRFDRGYVTALRQSLREGVVTLDAEDVVDATTRDAVSAFAEAPPAPIAPVPSEEAPRPAAPSPVLADPLLELAADLRSRDPQRIRKVLNTDSELDARLIPDVIPLLARDDLFGAAVRSLRKAAPRCTGQLVDALLEPGQDVVVRRRIPRVLRATPTQRAADGLLLGLRDERLDLRYRCAQALVRMKEANPALVISRQEMVAAALREIALGVHAGRSLDHVFSILSLVLEKELEIALRALRSSDAALRGTALEYLENVLPDPVRKGLWHHLGSPGPLAPSGRSHEEIRDDLLRSTVASRRSGLKRRLDTAG